ncbi:hypothetical protein BraRD5C2_12320 [Bradyrhizobium sp. RD5-C2]|nr:hypothetical protein BraRD5C2_12320 [Bradyrhizobium sp. RD5-C2]
MVVRAARASLIAGADRPSSPAQEVVMATRSNLSKAELARGVAGAASALVLSALVLFVAAHHLSGG